MWRFIFVLLFIYACSSEKEDTTNKNKECFYRIIFDKRSGLYLKAKYNIDSIPFDTVFYFKDSLNKDLVAINTLVYIDGNQKVNQKIVYEDGKIKDDVYFFNSEKIGDSIKVNVTSKYNDTMRILVGEFDENYRIVGRVDTFILSNGQVTFFKQPFYMRGLIGIWNKIPVPDSLKKIGTIGIRGKELYMPSKYLDPDS